MISGSNYIGFSSSKEGNSILQSYNPVEETNNDWSFREATDQEIEKAIALANQAFYAFRNKSNIERAVFLDEIANQINEIGAAITDAYCKESGLPSGRAEGERGRTVNQLKAFAKMLRDGHYLEAKIDTADPNRTPLPKDDIRKLNLPIGPIVVFGSSNFPLAFSTAGGDTASAFAAGCPVVVKAHPMHLATGELIAQAVIKAAKNTNMPEGVFSFLTGSGSSLGKKLVQHPLIKGVGFTGSTRVGKLLVEYSLERKEPIPVFSEMGSINPIVLFPNALKEKSEFWAKSIASSIALGTGQFCTNPGLLIAKRTPELDEFIAHLSQSLDQISASCMLHKNIKANYEANKELILSSNEIKEIVAAKPIEKANFSSPSLAQVSGKDFIKNHQLHIEVFGPFSLLIICENDTEVIEVIHALEGQLTGTIIYSETDNKDHLVNVNNSLIEKVGRIIFNGVPTGVEVCASMHHGGPYPSTTDSRFTSVGLDAVKRWLRPVSYQNVPEALLPEALKNSNPLNLLRFVDGEYTTKSI